METDDGKHGAAADAAVRRAAFAVAYRMLGSAEEAEDVVQEALLRLHEAETRGEAIAAPRAYIATVATRLAIDQLRSARVKRTAYPGEWLPEPLLTRPADPADDPAAQAELADSLSIAFLALLERLSPEQRAALLLHDVFGYGYDEVARIVGTTEGNARQLTTRARRHVGEPRARFRAPRERQAALAERFFAAAGGGDVGALEALLAEDVALHGDGGGKVPALARSLHGRARVARTLAAWARAADFAGGAQLRPAEVNGGPGALMVGHDGRVAGVLALELGDGVIVAIHSVVNPDKLGRLGLPVGSLRDLLRPPGNAAGN